jgi:hypothetical protein
VQSENPLVLLLTSPLKLFIWNLTEFHEVQHLQESMVNGHNKSQWYRTTMGSCVMISSMCVVGEQESKDILCYLSLRV